MLSKGTKACSLTVNAVGVEFSLNKNVCVSREKTSEDGSVENEINYRVQQANDSFRQQPGNTAVGGRGGGRSTQGKGLLQADVADTLLYGCVR